MKRLSLLLLDANVVIYLFGLGIWDKVVELCDIHLARTVVDQEAQFWEDEQGAHHSIDLNQYIGSNPVCVFDVLASDMQVFLDKFDPVLWRSSIQAKPSRWRTC